MRKRRGEGVIAHLHGPGAEEPKDHGTKETRRRARAAYHREIDERWLVLVIKCRGCKKVLIGHLMSGPESQPLLQLRRPHYRREDGAWVMTGRQPNEVSLLNAHGRFLDREEPIVIVCVCGHENRLAVKPLRDAAAAHRMAGTAQGGLATRYRVWGLRRSD